MRLQGKMTAAKILIAGLLLTTSILSSVEARIEGFYLESLPKGADVTLTKPATTFVPLNARVTLSSTDMPQAVSFKPVNVSGGAIVAVKISIFDPHQDRVKYAVVQPGTPFLYSFKDLGSVTIITDKVEGSSPSLRLQVESNKPLKIAH